MKTSKIAVQIYSFKDFAKTRAGLIDTLEQLSEMGYSAIQLAGSMWGINNPSELSKIFIDNNFRCCSSHESPKSIIEDRGQIIEKLQQLNCKHVVCPAMPWIPSGLGEAIALALELNVVAQEFQSHGIKLAFHNHATEFIKYKNRTIFEILFAYAPLLQGELDTYWVQYGGASNLDWIEKLTNRMDSIHLKDFGIVDNNSIVDKPIGSGNLNWHKIIPAAKEHGVEWFIIEDDGGHNEPFASFAQTMNYLKENFIEDYSI